MPVNKEKAAKVLICMPPEMLTILDDFAAFEYRGRSEMVREMIRYYTERNTVVKESDLYTVIKESDL